MAIRKIIKIDEAKCNGCGECIVNCPEGALQIIDGKAKLVKESYCDGLGACIGKCPLGAITIEEREADEFDEEAANANMARAAANAAKKQVATQPPHDGCPGTAVRQMAPPAGGCPGTAARTMQRTAGNATTCDPDPSSQLCHWPVQLMLVGPAAPFLRNADVLLTADCVPFAFAGFHQRFLAGNHPVLVACPKLDDNAPYVQKLSAMFSQAGMKSLTIIRMEVPCCGGLTRIVEQAQQISGSMIPLHEIIVSIDGNIMQERDV